MVAMWITLRITQTNCHLCARMKVTRPVRKGAVALAVWVKNKPVSQSEYGARCEHKLNRIASFEFESECQDFSLKSDVKMKIQLSQQCECFLAAALCHL